MKTAWSILAAALATTSAVAASFTTYHYSTWAEVQAATIGGFEWFARGDTEEISFTPASNPGDRVATDYDLWNSGVDAAFNVVYNPTGTPLGMYIDDEQAVYETPLPPIVVDSRTNGVLITAYASGAGRTVRIHNLAFIMPDYSIYEVGDIALAPGTDYLLIETDLPLTDGFIVNGLARFEWTGALAAPADQWFEVAPVVTPEPATGLLLGLTSVVILRRRR